MKPEAQAQQAENQVEDEEAQRMSIYRETNAMSSMWHIIQDLEPKAQMRAVRWLENLVTDLNDE